ncbi:MAG: hypothetical protein GYA23_06820 [Methanomicrobiales archaeon]|nr:hypothetical protein [Methanomicrobiales archaeon]
MKIHRHFSAGTFVAIVLLLSVVIAPVAADSMTREDGTDHDGSDYNTLFPGSPATYGGTAESCAAACLSDTTCNACTYLARDQSCWLKQTVPPASPRTGVVSFVKVRGEARANQAERPPEEPTPAKSPGFTAFAAVIVAAGVLSLRKI